MEASYTALHSFMNCEYSYFLRYIKRVPISESAASVYGTAVHHTLKLGYDNGLTKDELVGVFKSEWFALASNKDIVFNSEKEFIKKLNDGQVLVADYYDKFIKGKKPPKLTEFRFFRGEGVKIGNHTLIGVIDQIDSKGRVVDYKTGAKPTAIQLDFDLQFTIYSYAYRYLFGKTEGGLVLRHLGTMKDLTTTRVKSDFSVLSDEIDKIEVKMTSGVYCRNLDRGCSYCYYLKACLGKERKFERWAR